ncbi:type VI secretion system protein TssA [Vibrio coralliilyticus]|uniref:type VI secretion system protein TssA n=1 Tax=Vibrio coralliilyticus TaxID=190893 RepID=UPI0017E4A693|nr:type VI secretion system protein TssA [Vibrio coralliilyticus]NUW69665.1 type VI secretion system protein TssA [Vibrio coralliilyticus]
MTAEINTLLEPINEASPAGEDARYEFSFEMMEAEVKKFGSLFGETVDWAVVQSHATEVITKHSKDFKAMCYLTRALVESEGLPGLEQGLALLAESLIRFGSDLYPRRKRGRDGAVEWLNHQLKLALPKLPNEQLTWEALSRCNDAVEEIQRHFDEVFQDSEADFFELRSELNRLLQSAGVDETHTAPSEPEVQQDPVELSQPKPESQPSPEPTQSTPAVVKPSVAKPASRQQKEVDIDTDFSSPTASKRTLKKVAEMILASEPELPLSYRIHRHLTWSDIEELPDHQNNETPLILAVSQDKQSEYRDKAKQESDIDTIKRLERTLTDAPFWLTGHYYVYQMLKNLSLEEAAQAVSEEVKAFAQSLPGIEALSFKNSIPFANEATIEWLNKASSSASNAGQQVLPSVVVQEGDLVSMDDVTLENLGERVAEVAQNLELDSSGRGQFMLHLQIVKAYQAVGLYALCLPYLEKLWVIRDEMSLSSWEPHLSLQLDELSQKILKQLYPNKELLPAKFEEWESIYN